jgi:hypothetical protein
MGGTLGLTEPLQESKKGAAASGGSPDNSKNTIKRF